MFGSWYLQKSPTITLFNSMGFKQILIFASGPIILRFSKLSNSPLKSFLIDKGIFLALKIRDSAPSLILILC